MSDIIKATAFIDWDTARRMVQHDVNRGRERLVDRQLRELQEALALTLQQHDRQARFRVSLRLYHGWHRGRTKTQDRLEIERFLDQQGLQRAVGKVSFAPELAYSDELMCRSERRYLFDTLRRRQDGSDEQKMVDTALVSDLLHFVHSRAGALALVVGDDDDLLPGIFTAESWGCRVLLARLRTEDNQHLNTRGLIYRIRTAS